MAINTNYKMINSMSDNISTTYKNFDNMLSILFNIYCDNIRLFYMINILYSIYLIILIIVNIFNYTISKIKHKLIKTKKNNVYDNWESKEQYELLKSQILKELVNNNTVNIRKEIINLIDNEDIENILRKIIEEKNNETKNESIADRVKKRHRNKNIKFP